MVYTRDEARQMLDAAPRGPWQWSIYAGRHLARLCTEFQFQPGDGWLLQLDRDRLPSHLGDLIAAAPALAHTVVALHDRIAELEAERKKLGAEVAAFRGEDVDGWECGGDFYVPRDVDGVRPVVELHCDGVKWLPQVYTAEDDVAWCGEPTEGILAAMRKAKRVAHTFGWTP